MRPVSKSLTALLLVCLIAGAATLSSRWSAAQEPPKAPAVKTEKAAKKKPVAKPKPKTEAKGATTAKTATQPTTPAAQPAALVQPLDDEA